MKMQQRAFGCGERPAQGPIPRDEKIWEGINYAYRGFIKFLILIWGIWWWIGGTILSWFSIIISIIIAFSTILSLIMPERSAPPISLIFKTNDAKSCGDFDDDTSLGIYICENCFMNKSRRQNFLENYDISKAE